MWWNRTSPNTIRTMTWKELAAVQQAAAQYLFGTKEPIYERAICGRAYYAAYAPVTSRLSATTTFSRGWSNPSHATLPAYVDNISGLHDADRRAVRCALTIAATTRRCGLSTWDHR